MLRGEGHYVLSSIKHISVSEEFVGLDQTVTHCQMEEFRVDCLSRRFRDLVLATCNCAPWSLRSHFGASVPVCTPVGLDCVQEVRVEEDDCVERCQGTIMDAVRFNSKRDMEGTRLFQNEYEKYKFPYNISYPSAMAG